MKTPQWLARRRKSDPELPMRTPIPFIHNYSNGEYLYEQTPRDRLIEQAIYKRADEECRRHGLDRRGFLASTMGMMASLSVINTISGCSGGGGGGGNGDGGYQTSSDCEEGAGLIDGQDYFVFDMQTHHVDATEEYRTRNPQLYNGLPLVFPGGDCELGMNTNDCLDFDHYVQLVFMESDVTMAVLSGVASENCEYIEQGTCGLVMENDVMAEERDRINAAANHTQRMINHCNIVPNSNLPWQLDEMQNIAENYGVVGGWKLYTGWRPAGGQGWFMDDPDIGIPVIEKGIGLGVETFCVHKGPPLVGFDNVYNDARDMGVVAKAYPNANFVVYHSGLGFVNPVTGEGGGVGTPYDPALDAGTNNVIKALEDNGLGQGSNLYAELGSLWASVMSDSVAAQHLIGKLLKHFGDDNVLFGSECIWFVSPQPQIEALLALEISEEFQETYGYPELTDERKRKILGLNAAKLYGIDPCERRDQIDTSALGIAKLGIDSEFGERRWVFNEPLGPTTRREFMSMARYNLARNLPG